MNNQFIKVQAVGRLTKDPAIGAKADGTPYRAFGIAVNQFVNKEKITMFLNCMLWGEVPDFIASELKVGAEIFVVGDLRKFKTKEGDEQWSITCDPVNTYLPGIKPKSANGNNTPQNQAPKPKAAAPVTTYYDEESPF